MNRLLAMLLAVVAVGGVTAAALGVEYRQARAQVAAAQQALLQAQDEGQALRQQLDEAMAQAQALAEEQARAIWEQQEQERLQKEAEEAARQAAAQKTATPRGPASIDLGYWMDKYSDVVGYIYNPGTAISYPIVYGDTDFYLHHDLDGREDINGSIILASENRSDFSDGNSILYGHNMKAGNMFASLQYYKSHDFYLNHPCMYLYTPGQTYRVDLFAGFPTPADGEVYFTGLEQEKIDRFKAQSTFTSTVNPTGNILTLSTCSYEHENWRYVVLGELVPIS